MSQFRSVEKALVQSRSVEKGLVREFGLVMPEEIKHLQVAAASYRVSLKASRTDLHSAAALTAGLGGFALLIGADDAIAGLPAALESSVNMVGGFSATLGTMCGGLVLALRRLLMVDVLKASASLKAHMAEHARQGRIGAAYIVETITSNDELHVALLQVDMQESTQVAHVTKVSTWSVDPEIEAAVLTDAVFQIKEIAKRLEIATDEAEQRRVAKLVAADEERQERALALGRQHEIVQHALGA